MVCQSTYITKKEEEKKPNPNPIMHHLLLFLHHLCKSYNHKKKHSHLPHQHDADDGDHLFMSIIKKEGNHPSEDKQKEEEQEASHPNPSTSSPPSLSHTNSILRVIVVKQIVAFVVVHPLLEWVSSAPLLDSQVFSILSHTLHSCFCSQNSQPLLYFLLLHLHLL